MCCCSVLIDRVEWVDRVGNKRVDRVGNKSQETKIMSRFGVRNTDFDIVTIKPLEL